MSSGTHFERRACKKCGEMATKKIYPSGNPAPGLYDESKEMVTVATPWKLGWSTPVKGWLLTPHVCPPERFEAHQALLKQNRAREDERDMLLTAAWKDAKPRSCPTCKAEVEGPCTSLAKGSLGTHTRWPHSARYTDDFRAQYESVRDRAVGRGAK